MTVKSVLYNKLFKSQSIYKDILANIEVRLFLGIFISNINMKIVELYSNHLPGSSVKSMT